jgi:hypothetical protein
MSLFKNFVGVNHARERMIGRIIGEIGSTGAAIKREEGKLVVIPTYLLASSLAISVVVAGLCTFVIFASLAAWTMLNQ